jgi:hypothetical protein
MYIQRLSQAGCRATARSWHDHAAILRTSAQASYLNPAQRQQLGAKPKPPIDKPIAGSMAPRRSEPCATRARSK